MQSRSCAVVFGGSADAAMPPALLGPGSAAVCDTLPRPAAARSSSGLSSPCPPLPFHRPVSNVNSQNIKITTASTVQARGCRQLRGVMEMSCSDVRPRSDNLQLPGFWILTLIRLPPGSYHPCWWFPVLLTVRQPSMRRFSSIKHMRNGQQHASVCHPPPTRDIPQCHATNDTTGYAQGNTLL